MSIKKEKQLDPLEFWTGLKIAVVGAGGRMGRRFVQLFSALPCEIVCIDREEVLPKLEIFIGTLERKPHEVYSKASGDIASVEIAKADCVVISVPLQLTSEVMQAVLPHMKTGALAFDLSSVKGMYVKLMNEVCPKGVSVIGGHPLFGPYPSIKGEIIVLSAGKNADEWLLPLEETMDFFGLRIVHATAEYHDENVSYSQVLLHTTLFSFIATIVGGEKTAEELVPFATPLYKFEMDLAGRLLSQQKELYAAIAMQNSNSTATLRSMHNHLGEFIQLIEKKDFTNYCKKIASLIEGFEDLASANRRSRGWIEKTNNGKIHSETMKRGWADGNI